jgi:SAM-dependent methyltransferase
VRSDLLGRVESGCVVRPRASFCGMMASMSARGGEVPAEPVRRMAEFHRRFAGVTQRAWARGRDERGRSSYELLAELVAPGERVLDLGCGDGPLLARLRDRGATAVGLDRSSAEADLARGAGFAVVRAAAAELPFAAAAFDWVLSHLAFSVMEQGEQIVAELERVVARPGGVAAIVGGGPAATSGGEVFEQFLTLLAEALGGRTRCRFGDRRAHREEGWRGFWEPLGFATEWSRHEIDLSGTFEQVWGTLASAYDCMLLSDAELAELKRQLAARCDARFAGRPIPLAAVVWRAVARR